MSVRMLADSDARALLALGRAHGLSDADLCGLAIGCPRHGNASMDFDSDGTFCHACEREGRL